MAWQRFFVAWRSQSSLLPLAASIVAVIHQSSPPQLESATTSGKVREPFTGIEFSWKRDFTQTEAKGNYQLLGTAVRCMLGQCKFSKARAYAVGLYVEDGNDIRQWKNMGPEKVGQEVGFDELLAMHTSRSLVLVMDQDVAGHHIAKGFDRSLLPRIRKAQGGKSGPGKDALREFSHCLTREKMLRKGSEISLVWRPDDTLVVLIDSSVRGVISSSILCEAIFDMYLGPDSIFKKYRNMSFTFHKEETRDPPL